MKSDGILGIREKELSSLCIDIIKISDEIADIFNKIDTNMYAINDIYKSSSMSSLMNSYEEFRKNYKIAKSNINSYSDDLTELVNKVHSGVKNLINIYERSTNDMKAKTKAVGKLEV